MVSCVTICFLTLATAVPGVVGLTEEIGVNVTDLYNSATGIWSTARLSVGRCCLAATSVGTLAIFAGGYLTSRALMFM